MAKNSDEEKGRGQARRGDQKRSLALVRMRSAVQAIAALCGNPATSDEEQRELNRVIGGLRGAMRLTEDPSQYAARANAYAEAVKSVNLIGKYLPEEEDPDVLVFGPWLERGGSAFWISTSGTGKSIACMQLAHCWAQGVEFCGLRPRAPMTVWIFQSEDSPRRIALDRADVRAELAERYPGVDWAAAGERVKVIALNGTTGAAFIQRLDALLSEAKGRGESPDVIILNPFLAFIGGPITDGAYVTPFLRGGTINGETSKGLQAVLEAHRVGVLVFHHTPKPPTDKEIDAWLKSAFPEYQGAGSSDITNWGRSFVTMMRVKGHGDMVMLTAGKNGAELGWEQLGGAYRRYLAYSGKKSDLSGKARHAWRELTEDEYDEVTKDQRKDDDKRMAATVAAMLAALHKKAMTKNEMRDDPDGLIGGSRNDRAAARAEILGNLPKYRITETQIKRGNGWVTAYGFADAIAAARAEASERGRYEAAMRPQQQQQQQQQTEEDIEDEMPEF